jgi:hypothetical protein
MKAHPFTFEERIEMTRLHMAATGLSANPNLEN